MSSGFEGTVPPACLIVGLGNSLMQDDGVGVHAARRLMADPPPGALVLEVGTDVFSAVSWLETVPWVLAIDAMDAGGRPGTIYHCDISDVADADRPISLHELSLVAVLEFIPVERRPKITVLGVQPELVQYGLDLSPVLVKSLPQVLEAARGIVAAREAGQGERRTVNPDRFVRVPVPAKAAQQTSRDELRCP